MMIMAPQIMKAMPQRKITHIGACTAAESTGKSPVEIATGYSPITMQNQPHPGCDRPYEWIFDMSVYVRPDPQRGVCAADT